MKKVEMRCPPLYKSIVPTLSGLQGYKQPKTIPKSVFNIQTGLHLPAPTICISAHFSFLTFKSHITLSSHTALSFELLNQRQSVKGSKCPFALRCCSMSALLQHLQFGF